jgi:transcriptional regulator PpsR
MVIGKNLEAVAELQSRLIAAQQAMEQDYWKLREVETRYRLLFDASNEPVLLIKAADLRIIEANAAAIRALGMTTSGRLLLPELASKEQAPFQAMLLRVREHGKAPGVLVHLGRDREPWLVRASLMTAEPGPVFLLQLTPVGAAQTLPNWGGAVSVDEMVGRLPDGFVVLDANGVVVRANQAFLDLVQVGSEGAVVGERLARWLWRPGADLTVLLANVRQHGAVRLFVTTIHGELGLDTEVEISAGGDLDREPAFVAALVRDVGRRLAAPGQRNNVNALSGAWADQIGKTSLEGLVKSTVGVVERQYIEAALDLTKGNRTAAAQLLGLSRQSLYAKLHRYGLNGSATDRS